MERTGTAYRRPGLPAPAIRAPGLNNVTGHVIGTGCMNPCTPANARPRNEAPKRSEIPRLRKRREFLAAAQGRKWAAPGVVLQALARGDGAGPRAGFTVTRKVGKAVIRNRVRRRLRAAAAEILPLHAKPGYDYVLVGRIATLTRPWSDLLNDLRVALGRVHSGENGARRRSSHRSSEGKEDTFHG